VERISLLLVTRACAVLHRGQSAEDLVVRNILAHGGVDKVNSIRRARMTGA